MLTISPYYNEGFDAFMNKEPNPYDHLAQYVQHREWNMGYNDAAAANDG